MYLRKMIYVSSRDRIIVHGITAKEGNEMNPLFGLNLFVRAGSRRYGEVTYDRSVGIREFQEVKQRLGLRVYHMEEGMPLRYMILLGP